MRFSFILSETWNGLRRNMSMVVSVILVTFVSLLFVGAAALLQMQISGMKDYWYDRVQVAIFLCPPDSEAPTCATGEATAEQKQQIETALEGADLSPYVEDVIFEDKAMAYKLFQEQFAGTSLEGSIPQDQMQESYRVKLADAEQYEIINEYFSATPGVEEVVDQNQLLDQLFSVMNVMTAIAIGIAAIMLLCAVLLIATTIRLSAFSRRRETGIMRLVGASNMFIQLPFVLEGVIAAAIGSLMAALGLAVIVHFGITGWLQSQLASFDLVSVADVALIAPFLVLVGVLMAGLSSLVTLRRYMKV
ncbi:permease-like cell division protein FtsX [Brevibacterium luteolum]|uniref:Cell division protein FtsX n=1 Tax=Brevibacterium luteolum TaxID=199591 RepID=A0A2N6PEQ3_9MICO|nr:permease-like cell division protein FtsX [Brevibacterium luteolum]MBM7529299.1 cell division transport system permease protein [Brevibacterium luteolum]MCT1829054.1 permease-like cell division protein FtsX [Brevibacterium luteolum]MCT1872521.1 permease-like cell division protein FtsX [Brevibacterium luteolum]MCT1890422.1 permease-like cell division protein FtsX [Brevibacterium luteolum]MCT1892912.1 permease-like cell division protein FtsX [Brevibacterium luteolum]